MTDERSMLRASKSCAAPTLAECPARHARVVFFENAPRAIDDQSANRSAGTKAPDAGVMGRELISF
jgi:hypothetical protein